MIRPQYLAITLAFFIASGAYLIPVTADAKTLSAQSVNATGLRIVQTGANPAQRTGIYAWGITKDNIGAGDIGTVSAVDIYLDSEYRMEAIRVTRESYEKKRESVLIRNVSEFTVETPGADAQKNIPAKKINITVRTMDDFTVQ